ncbi:hypothetical protein HY478_02550 [Candidatus Uhrbacteria bacterium]|nr:hypothetical protein [Candidatus Uhrbacteria bacterium]
MKAYVVFLILAPLIVLGVLFLNSRLGAELHSPEVTLLPLQFAGATTSDMGSGVPTEDVSSLPLYIPLEETLSERNEFRDLLNAELTFNLRSLYETYIDRIGANGLIATLEDARPYCHDEGHDLGRAIYARLSDLGTGLRVCQDACFSGCMHGILMEFFTETDEEFDEHVTLSDIAEKIHTVCAMNDMASLYKAGDCAHGIGHALMFLTGYNIPRALEYCELLTTYPMQYYCATGAYMEYVTTKDPEESRTRGTFYPCDIGPYPAACFRYKLLLVARRHYTNGGTFADFEAACLRLEDPYQRGCFHGFGNAHAGPLQGGALSLAELCRAGTREDQYVCIEGALERLAKYHPEEAPHYCSSVAGWQNELCLEAAARNLYNLEKSFEYYGR